MVAALSYAIHNRVILDKAMQGAGTPSHTQSDRATFASQQRERRPPRATAQTRAVVRRHSCCIETGTKGFGPE